MTGRVFRSKRSPVQGGANTRFALMLNLEIIVGARSGRYARSICRFASITLSPYTPINALPQFMLSQSLLNGADNKQYPDHLYRKWLQVF